MKYRVIRQHLGDKMYMPGDERELAEADAKHLVPHVLSPLNTKAEMAPRNKMELRPSNKDDRPDYHAMTVADLKAFAEERSVDLGDATKKADIIAALELSDEQNQQ